MSKPKVYFAGKVRNDGWRQQLFGRRVMSRGYAEHDMDGLPVLYGGPFAISCDHSCFHGTLHGMASRGECYGSYEDYDGTVEAPEHEISQTEVVGRCLCQIMNSALVVAYIESLDCYGTLIELGYASAKSIPVMVFIDDKLEIPSRTYFDPAWRDKPHCADIWVDDLWFVKTLFPLYCSGAPTKKAIRDYLLGLGFHPDYQDYLRSEHWQKIRTVMVEKAGYSCQLCNGDGQLHVHHRRYDNLYKETEADLIVLCKRCHEKFHDIVPKAEG